ncbi:MAG TPA: alpha/beta hydrolase [Caulobacteraceae bacterium]
MQRAWFALAAAAAVFVSSGFVAGARAAERWEIFTRPPPLPPAQMEGRVVHDGARIWFATFGAGPPVILLHGFGGASDNFGFQVPALIADGRRVIVIDSRGQGRSTHDAREFNYELMESDVVAVMDAIGVRKADVVGWSDGAILGLIMAMKHPERTNRIFAFSPLMDTSGYAKDWLSKPIMAPVIEASTADYLRLSPNPGDLQVLMDEAGKLSATQPNYTANDLAKIHGPAIAIVDGDHEELIPPEHTRYIARTIPGAKLIILPGVSHFAPGQAPDEFNKAMIDFLDAR